MGAAIVAWGAASALGVGRTAFDVGGAGVQPRAAWSSRSNGKPFGRVTACSASRAERPRALLELGLAQVVQQLNERKPNWHQLRLGIAIGTSSGGLAALERALTDDAEVWENCAYFAPLRAALQRLQLTPRRLVSLHAACASSTLALGLAMRELES